MTPTSPDLWLYAGWAASYTIIFSFTGGIFHAYYLAVIGPPLAALCGIGLAQAVEPGKIDRIRFGAVIALTALWQCYLGYGFVLENSTRLWPWVSLVAPVAAVMLASSISPRTAVVVGAVAGLFLVNPLLWSASTWSNAGPAILPAAELSVWNETGGDPERQWRKTVRQTEISSADPKLIAFLAANMGESKFAAVTPTTRLAAPIINRSGLPIMAFGGFSGLDPILSLDQLKERARNGDFRYVLFGAGVAQGPRPQLNDDDPRRAFIRWVRANGKPVPPALWRSPDANGERLFLFEIKLRDAGD